MASIKYSDSTIDKWTRKMADELSSLKFEADHFNPHFGTGNGKTHAVNEGTLPLVTCPQCARTSCGRSCYAFRCVMSRPSLRACYARNTALRRLDAVRYYRMAFMSAMLAGAVLRVNESGDFENVDQIRAFFDAASEFPTVKAIAYTRRDFLFDLYSEKPDNVAIHYSVFTEVERVKEANARGVPATCVSATPDDVQNCVKCPHNSNPDWTCAACAAAGICCASAKNVCFKLS